MMEEGLTIDDLKSAEEVVGDGVGSVAAALAGAGLGSMVGPLAPLLASLGTMLGGWWADEAVGRAVEDFPFREDAYKEHFDGAASETAYGEARIGYTIGHLARRNPDYEGRSFAEVEAYLQRALGETYDELHPFIHGAYDIPL